jgi:hypothetical protein
LKGHIHIFPLCEGDCHASRKRIARTRRVRTSRVTVCLIGLVVTCDGYGALASGCDDRHAKVEMPTEISSQGHVIVFRQIANRDRLGDVQLKCMGSSVPARYPTTRINDQRDPMRVTRRNYLSRCSFRHQTSIIRHNYCIAFFDRANPSHFQLLTRTSQRHAPINTQVASLQPLDATQFASPASLVHLHMVHVYANTCKKPLHRDARTVVTDS